MQQEHEPNSLYVFTTFLQAGSVFCSPRDEPANKSNSKKNKGTVALYVEAR